MAEYMEHNAGNFTLQLCLMEELTERAYKEVYAEYFDKTWKLT
jgi:hypothetical protein